MDSALSTKDVIRKSILETFSDAFSDSASLTWETVIYVIVALLVSLLMGLLIYYVYKKSFRGVVYSKTFGIALVGMTVMTCMVTLAISTNIVLSLGMVGALSIVRYRTAIKEPLDLLFIFWAITSGITIGARMFYLAITGAIAVIAVLLILGMKKSGSRVYVMIVHYKTHYTGDEIRRVMKDMRYIVKSRTMRKAMTELTAEVYVKKDNLSFIEQIRDLENVTDVTLVEYNGEYHG